MQGESSSPPRELTTLRSSPTEARATTEHREQMGTTVLLDRTDATETALDSADGRRRSRAGTVDREEMEATVKLVDRVARAATF